MSATFRLAQYVAALPGGSLLRSGFRAAQTWLDYQDSHQLKKLLDSSALRGIQQQQPQLARKYLSEGLAAGFTRQQRLASLGFHYEHLLLHTRVDFFDLVLSGLCLWQEQRAGQLYSIVLGYPLDSDFEGELSLQFQANGTLLYTVVFTLVPGQALQLPAEAAVLVSRVQGARHFALIKEATKSLHDIAPPALLLQAVHSLAQAVGVRLIVGVGTSQQLSWIRKRHQFDYDEFWHQFGALQGGNGLFVLPLSLLGKPLEAVKTNHRSRTVRKRHYKQQVQDGVGQYVREYLLAGSSAELPYDSSRCTVAGLNAGTHIDQYSHSSPNGLE